MCCSWFKSGQSQRASWRRRRSKDTSTHFNWVRCGRTHLSVSNSYHLSSFTLWFAATHRWRKLLVEKGSHIQSYPLWDMLSLHKPCTFGRTWPGLRCHRCGEGKLTSDSDSHFPSAHWSRLIWSMTGPHGNGVSFLHALRLWTGMLLSSVEGW